VEVTPDGLARFFEVVLPHMNEVQRRVVAGAAAEMFGRGGKSAVAVASGMSRNTVIKAAAEVAAGIVPSERLRAEGGGDKPLIDKQPGLLESLDGLVHPDTRGSPMSLLRWTSKSSTTLADDLAKRGFTVSSRTVLRLLHYLGFSLQANAKVIEGSQHVDRDAQFHYLNDRAGEFVSAGEPAISVDTKKKELIGNYANGGQTWEPAGQATEVNDHDFADRALGEFAKAIPYGVYDTTNNEGWVSVGDTADTAEFAVEAIRRWWNQMGRTRFPNATRLLITADAGGSNGYRVRAWKAELAKFAAETGTCNHGLSLSAGHFEMEQDRAPHVLVHLDELARSAAHQPARDRRPDRCDHHNDRVNDPSRSRSELVSQRRQDQRHRTRRPPTHTPRMARRMELHTERPNKPDVNP
jgi:hypothetical protein